MDIYFNTINVIEEAVNDDDKYPVIKDNKVKKCCQMTLELTKLLINYVRFTIKNATQKKKEH